MNILGKLLGSQKVIESAANGIDKLFFTKEEKSENWINTLNAYEPFKIAQRLLALMVVGVFLLTFIVACALMVFSFWYEDTGGIGKLIIKYNQDTLGFSVALIIGFYFGGGAIEGVVNKFKGKTK